MNVAVETRSRSIDLADIFADDLVLGGRSTFLCKDFLHWLHENDPHGGWTMQTASLLLQRHRHAGANKNLLKRPRYIFKVARTGRDAPWSIAEPEDGRYILRRACREGSQRVINEIAMRVDPATRRDPVARRLIRAHTIMALRLLEGLAEALSEIEAEQAPATSRVA
jgi:hypothetical protein